MFRYRIATEKPMVTLHYLRRCLLFACELAVRAGDADPAKVINEVRGVLGTLQERWQGKRRDEVLQMTPAVPMQVEEPIA